MKAFDRIVAITLPLVPKSLVRRVSRPYIAGEKAEDMLSTVRRLNENGFVATVDILGEFSETPEQADRATRQYSELMDRFVAEELGCKVSVKLTQLGLKIDPEFCMVECHNSSFANCAREMGLTSARKSTPFVCTMPSSVTCGS